MVVAVLIGIMISVVVGVSLIPMLTETVEEATKDSEDLPEAASALLNILPIVFVVVLLLGAVAWIGGLYGSSTVTKSKSEGYHFDSRGQAYSGKDLLDRIEREEEIEEIEEEEEEDEASEIPGTLEVPGLPQAPPSSSKPSGKPPWAK